MSLLQLCGKNLGSSRMDVVNDRSSSFSAVNVPWVHHLPDNIRPAGHVLTGHLNDQAIYNSAVFEELNFPLF